MSFAPNLPNSLVYLALTRTPTHVGCGQGLGDIDLPVQRSISTGLPIMASSSIKGVLRQHAPKAWACTANELIVLFGPERDEASKHAGMLTMTDARLLALPVASLQGGWAWVTCLDALRRFRRDALECACSGVPDLPPPLKSGRIQPSAGSELVVHATNAEFVVLLELVLNVEKPNLKLADDTLADPALQWGRYLADWAFPDDEPEWRESFASRLVIVAEDDFRHFATVATEVRARVSLDENRVAKSTGLWREECVPADSLFWGSIGAQSVVSGVAVSEAAALGKVARCQVQIGGKASVGYGCIELLPQQRTAS
jgi:CRISPR-associated protein Cmr4